MLESKVQASIVKYLEKLPNSWVRKTITTNRAGTPDILMCYNGLFIAFEVKSDKGRATTLQEVNIQKIQESGGKAFIVRSKEEVVKIIENINIELHK